MVLLMSARVENPNSILRSGWARGFVPKDALEALGEDTAVVYCPSNPTIAGFKGISDEYKDELWLYSNSWLPGLNQVAFCRSPQHNDILAAIPDPEDEDWPQHPSLAGSATRFLPQLENAIGDVVLIGHASMVVAPAADLSSKACRAFRIVGNVSGWRFRMVLRSMFGHGHVLFNAWATWSDQTNTALQTASTAPRLVFPNIPADKDLKKGIASFDQGTDTWDALAMGDGQGVEWSGIIDLEDSTYHANQKPKTLLLVVRKPNVWATKLPFNAIPKSVVFDSEFIFPDYEISASTGRIVRAVAPAGQFPDTNRGGEHYAFGAAGAEVVEHNHRACLLGLHRAAATEIFRPWMKIDNDGSFVDPTAHPNLAIYNGHPYAEGWGTDPLGKSAYGSTALDQWAPHDGAHRSFYHLLVAYTLTGSETIGDILRSAATLELSGIEYYNIPRYVGRWMAMMAGIAWVLPDMRAAIISKLQGFNTNYLTHLDAVAPIVGDPEDQDFVISTDPNSQYVPGVDPSYAPWQDSLACWGFFATDMLQIELDTPILDSECRDRMLLVARSILREGYWSQQQGLQTRYYAWYGVRRDSVTGMRTTDDSINSYPANAAIADSYSVFYTAIPALVWLMKQGTSIMSAYDKNKLRGILLQEYYNVDDMSARHVRSWFTREELDEFLPEV